LQGTDHGAVGINPASSSGTVDAAAALRFIIFQGGRVHGDNLVADSLLASAKQRLVDLRASIDQEVRDASWTCKIPPKKCPWRRMPFSACR
jgi:hypothetical protein